ncbi:MAG: WecB/TagA/CpsF family glycosyltransferase [bacterium]|nr:WecB/TagA/CpsF family glycosyltransferase [bacterium]
MSDDSIYYDSYKEDRDLVLEYNQVDLNSINMINIGGIGVHNLTRTEAVARVLQMIKEGGIYHVIPLNPYKIRKINKSADLKLLSDKTDLHLASGAGVQWAANMLKTPIKEMIPVLSFMMELIRIVEIKEYSIFLVGGRPEVVETAFFNIKKSFPNVRIVGRHGGYFNPQREKSVIEAMRKSEANIVFVGLGFPKEDKWIHKIKREFKNTVFISVGGSIDIISGEIKKAPPFFMERGLDWFYRIITKPWRIGRLFRTLSFFMGILFKKIFNK